MIAHQQAVPADKHYSFPPEWAKHEATWLSWPHKEASWPGKLEAIYPPYCKFIETLTLSEKVRINVCNNAMKEFALLSFFYTPPTMPGAATTAQHFW
jgi:agmatine deiminase